MLNYHSGGDSDALLNYDSEIVKNKNKWLLTRKGVPEF